MAPASSLSTHLTSLVPFSFKTTSYILNDSYYPLSIHFQHRYGRVVANRTGLALPPDFPSIVSGLPFTAKTISYIFNDSSHIFYHPLNIQCPVSVQPRCGRSNWTAPPPDFHLSSQWSTVYQLHFLTPTYSSPLVYHLPPETIILSQLQPISYWPS